MCLQQVSIARQRDNWLTADSRQRAGGTAWVPGLLLPLLLLLFLFLLLLPIAACACLLIGMPPCLAPGAIADTPAPRLLPLLRLVLGDEHACADAFFLLGEQRASKRPCCSCARQHNWRDGLQPAAGLAT